MMSLRHNIIFTATILAAFLAAQVTPHVLSATEESEVKAIPNPHSIAASCDVENDEFPSDSCDASASSFCETSFLLSPHHIIRTPIATQTDTLIEITTKKVLSVPVPVYRFRQPARLSALELPFQLILVNDIDAGNSLHAITVDPKEAADSWFLGYSWSPVVYTSCGEVPVHVGWKFIRNNDASRSDSFYALIVDAKEEEKSAVRVGVGAIGDVISESLGIGTRAPAWMIDLLTKL